MSKQSQPLSSLPIPPSSLVALTKAGYETLDDLSQYNSTNQLTDALKIPLETSQTIFYSSQRQEKRATSGGSALPSTQSAASLIKPSKQKSRIFTTYCPPVDDILGGGIAEGHILELSGPPGSPKELVLLNIVRSFVQAGRRVLLVDCQDMCHPRLVANYIKVVPGADQLVSYIKVDNPTDFMVFMHNLSSDTSFSLLAISCISFPFQNPGRWSNSARNSLLEKIKQTFTNLCTSHNITIVATSQLATKLINTDGSIGNFDSAGAKGVMVPQLGSTYLPSAKTFRILIALNGASRGSARLLAPVKAGKGALVKSFEMRGRIFEARETEN